MYPRLELQVSAGEVRESLEFSPLKLLYLVFRNLCHIAFSSLVELYKTSPNINVFYSLLRHLLLAFLSAKVTVELTKDSSVQAAVMLHPSLVTVDDIQGMLPLIKFPITSVK